MKRATLLLSIPVLLALPLAGCESTPNSSSFSRGEANTMMTVYPGTVTAVRGVQIRSGNTRIGAITGAIIGGALGSTIGSSTAANVAGAAGGAAVGGVAGNAIEGSGRTNGVELTMRLDSGETVAVVQPGNPNDWRVGDRVRVTGSAENARVTR